MVNQKLPPQQGEQSIQHMELEKKLRKREHRMQERLQEAQEAHAKALERLKRAETRLEKRQSRIQRVEGRLALIRQQLEELSHLTSVIIPGSEKQRREDVPQIGEVLLEQELLSSEWWAETTKPAEDVQQEQELLAEELRVGAVAPSADPIPVSTAEASEETLYTVRPDQDRREQEGAVQVEPPTATTTDPSSQRSADPNGFARVARAVAETAEHAARLAMDRALEIASRLEQMSAGRHLEQELSQTQSEAEQASIIAQKAELAAQEAEKRASELDDQAQESEEAQESQLLQTAEEIPQNGQSTAAPEEVQPSIVGAGLAPAHETAPTLEMAPAQETPRAQETTPTPETTPALETIPAPEAAPALETAPAPEASPLFLEEPDEDIKEIEEEEEVVSAVASMMIADVAAAAAAEAEALAEASSSRTREARYVALQADQVLEEVRAAISSGALNGEDAERYVQDAERNATRAHAVLADAEATEEQARTAAMNAEAEAEVAEGMAFASSDRAEKTLEEAEPPVSMQEHTEPLVTVGEDDAEITSKMPATHLQESE